MNLNIAALAWRNIRTRKARSWLTILGVLIGATAIVTLVAIGTGVEQAVLRQFRDVGLDVVLLVPGETTGQGMSAPPDFGAQISVEGKAGGSPALGAQSLTGLTGSEGSRVLDPSALRREVPAITEIGQVSTRVFAVSAGQVSGFVRVVTPSRDLVDGFPGLLGGFEIAEGHLAAPDASSQVVLGAGIAVEMSAGVGDVITVDGVRLTVSGILKPSVGGNPAIGGDLVTGQGAEAFQSLASTDDAVFVLHEHSAALWPDMTMSSIVAVRIRTGISVTETIEQINGALELQGLRMTPISTQALADNVQRTLGMVEIVLVSIASISLLVGAVGMMNTMYTSVLERTREIGILKSVGAKDRQVLGLFLLDSGLMGLAGGGLGAALGVVASFLSTDPLGDLIGVTTFAPVFPAWLLAGAVGLSCVLGSLAGLWPAWHAARTDPVTALAAE